MPAFTFILLKIFSNWLPFGRYHGYGNPEGVISGELDGTLNYNENGCGALSTVITLGPGEAKTIGT